MVWKVHLPVDVQPWILHMLIVLVVLPRGQHCLDNGLALSPPMGWITSERFECNVDCQNYPDDCISENLVKTTADAMVSQGFHSAGYKYLILGDCWQSKQRDPKGNLQADAKRFPGGMKALADYLHQKGLYLGVLLDLGNATCNGYPGSQDHFQEDAATVAGWGVDYVKTTACNVADGQTLNTVYPSMGSYLNKTGRPMVYACDWPIELKNKGVQVDYSKVAHVCNVYSTNKPMVDSWESLEANIKYFENLGRDLVNYTGPGHWNLPNLLMVGNYGLSEHTQHMQMAVWSIMAAPLLVSADLRHISPEQKAILLNKGTLSIDQDTLWKMGTEINIEGQIHIWKKAIQPAGSYALLFMYFNISGGPSRLSIIVSDLGLKGAEAYSFTNVFTGEKIGVYRPWYHFDTEVDPVGALFVRADPLP